MWVLMTGITGDSSKSMAARQREMRRADRLTLGNLTTALTQDDFALLSAATRQIDDRGLWRRAMLVVAQIAPLSAVMQQRFLRIWKDNGDHIRQETLDDNALIDGLRVLL